MYKRRAGLCTEQAVTAHTACAWSFMEPPALGGLQMCIPTATEATAGLKLSQTRRTCREGLFLHLIVIYHRLFRFETDWVMLDSVARKTLKKSIDCRLMKLQILVTASGSA